MTTAHYVHRDANSRDIGQLLPLWGSLFDEVPPSLGPWAQNAAAWFEMTVDDRRTTYFPVIETDGEIIACAIGTLELGVPNPQSPSGRVVRLANVVTKQSHRNQGHGRTLVDAVITWARHINADRVDLSATGRTAHIRARWFCPDPRASDEAAAVAVESLVWIQRFSEVHFRRDSLCTSLVQVPLF